MIVSAGLIELGYIALTESLLGGPVGVVVAIIGSVGSIIVLLSTDSDYELFANNCLWGNEPHNSHAHPGWSVSGFNQYTEDEEGINFQLKSILNLMHKFEEVRDKYDDITHVVAIEIDTKFLPDTTVFVVKAQFMAGSRVCRAVIRVRYPSRTRDRYTTVTPHQSGDRLIRGVNTMVETGDDHHTIKINIGVDHQVNQGKAWVCCSPFGTSEFSVPNDDRGIYLEECTEPRMFFRDHSFDHSEWRTMPDW